MREVKNDFEGTTARPYDVTAAKLDAFKHELARRQFQEAVRRVNLERAQPHDWITDGKQKVIQLLQDRTVDSTQRLLEILHDGNPTGVENATEFEKTQLEKSTAIVVVGETGAGKSSFCGLCDGSLREVWLRSKISELVSEEEHCGWTSNFKLGHGTFSETKESHLRYAQWLGDGDPLILMDTPAQDEDCISRIGHHIEPFPKFHGIVLVVKNSLRIPLEVRSLLQAYQEKFGMNMWANCLVVVQEWKHTAKEKRKRQNFVSPTEQQFENNFRTVLTQPLPTQATQGANHGLGLSEEQADLPHFFFIDSHYDRDDEDETNSMDEELERLKRELDRLKTASPTGTVDLSPSDLLKSMIQAVKSPGPAEMREVEKLVEAAEKALTLPQDVTAAKLDAFEIELQRRYKEKREERRGWNVRCEGRLCFADCVPLFCMFCIAALCVNR